MIISPRVIIVNALGRELELKQEGVESSAGYEDPFAGGGGGGGFQGYDYDGDDFGDDDYYDHDYGEGGGAGAKGSARAARRGSYASLRHKHMKGGVGHGMGGSSMGETGGAQLGNGMFFGVDDQRPFHWPNGRGDRSLRLRLREYGAQWSGRFSIDWDPSTMGTGSGHRSGPPPPQRAHARREFCPRGNRSHGVDRSGDARRGGRSALPQPDPFPPQERDDPHLHLPSDGREERDRDGEQGRRGGGWGPGRTLLWPTEAWRTRGTSPSRSTS